MLTECLADPPDPLHGPLPAVMAWTRAVLVVEISRAIKRGRDIDRVSGAELEDLVVQQGQVGGDDKRQVLAVGDIHLLSLKNDLLDQGKVEERLAALEFDLQ